MTSQVECQLTPLPPGLTFPKVSTEKLQLQSDFTSWVSIDPPQDEHFQRCVQKSCSCKVTSQVECWSTPQNKHFQRWVQKSCSCKVTSQVEHRLTPSPPLPPHLTNDKFKIECWSTPLPSPPSPPNKWQLQSWVSIDPPSPPLPPHLTNDNFKVECWLTPPPLPSLPTLQMTTSKLSVDWPPLPTPPSPPNKWQLQSWVLINPLPSPPSPPNKWQLQSWVSIDPPPLHVNLGPINSF